MTPLAKSMAQSLALQDPPAVRLPQEPASVQLQRPSLGRGSLDRGKPRGDGGPALAEPALRNNAPPEG